MHRFRFLRLWGFGGGNRTWKVGSILSATGGSSGWSRENLDWNLEVLLTNKCYIISDLSLYSIVSKQVPVFKLKFLLSLSISGYDLSLLSIIRSQFLIRGSNESEELKLLFTYLFGVRVISLCCWRILDSMGDESVSDNAPCGTACAYGWEESNGGKSVGRFCRKRQWRIWRRRVTKKPRELFHCWEALSIKHLEKNQ